MSSQRKTLLGNAKHFPKVSSLKGKCPTGKVRFRDHKEAVRALHRTQVNAKWALEDGLETNRRERRPYLCPICKGHHLTSWETPTSGPASSTTPDTTPDQHQERQAA